MKRSLLLAVLLTLGTLTLFAQNELLVQREEKGLYLNHVVVAKENFYSVGRLYNISPKEIADFNGLDMNKGLNIDQVIKIPLTTNNFSQTSDKGRPVYYVVAPKEGLYRVSQNNGGVLMANLRKWNSLPTDNLNTGQKLIVGFLISPEANRIPGSIVDETDTAIQPVEAVTNEVKKEEVKEVQIKDEQITKEEVKKPEVKKQEPQITPPVAATNGQGGYFKAHFEAQTKSQPAKKESTVSTGIFKTSSGWQDGKYYALMDGVDPGTIIKITNPSNGKVIYAKVLGEMSGIRQNQGYDLRISNAAASALEVGDTEKFIVKINY